MTSNETSTPSVALPASFVLPNISKRAFRWGRYLDRRSGWSSIDKSSNAHRIIVQMSTQTRSITDEARSTADLFANYTATVGPSTPIARRNYF